MKKRFKRIYVEITNLCNLKCSFCGESKRNKREMSSNEFELILTKIKDYTDYICLHIKGEPLLHSEFDNILFLCDKYNMKVVLTTNGTVLKRRFESLSKHNCIYQLNISLHSENNYKDYFKNVFDVCSSLSNKFFISYRIWTLSNLKLDKKSTDIVDKIIDYYKLSSEIVEKIYTEKDIRVATNIFLNKENMFIWPDIKQNGEINAMCYGLNTHIGILSDGTVVPCCLDAEGKINLGNIFDEDLYDILNSDLSSKIIDGFKNNISYCELCKNCNFRNRFIKIK